MRVFRDTAILLADHLRTTMRFPVWIIVGLFQPICYLFLFGPLLAPLASAPGFPTTNASLFFIPGLLVMTAIFGAGFNGFGLIGDLRAGVIERLRVTPASRLALLLSLVLRDALILLVQCALLTGVALWQGLRPDPGGVGLLGVLLLLVGVTTASCSYGLALLLRNENALASTINFLVMPLFLLAGITLPLSLGPTALQHIARFDPFAHAVDASRALLAGHLADAAVWQGFALFAILAALALTWATRAMRRATA